MSGELGNDRVHITEATPKVQLEGTEASAGNFSVKEDSGALEVFDETNAATLFSVAANQPMVIDIPIPVIFERSTGNLDASSPGVRFETQDIFPSWQHSATAAIAATWTASGTASVTRIQLVDRTAGSEVAFVEGNAGTSEKSDYGSLTEHHAFGVKVKVTTAGGAAATTSCRKAVIYMRVSFA